MSYFQASRRQTPVDDAKFWCDIGLDKDGFERKFVSNEIGMFACFRNEFLPLTDKKIFKLLVKMVNRFAIQSLYFC